MIYLRQASRWALALAIVTVVAGSIGLTLGILRMMWSNALPAALAGRRLPEADQAPHGKILRVAIVHPKRGFLQRVWTQECSIEPYASVRLFAKVPGFLKLQNVDIGDRVEKGALLAVVDQPELEIHFKRAKAVCELAKARVAQKRTRVVCAEADLAAAIAAVTRAEATHNAASAWVQYRTLQHRRMEELFASGTIDERLRDESKERLVAAIESEASAKEAVAMYKRKVVAAQVKVEDARADLEGAEARVRVVKDELGTAQLQVASAEILAPFAGVVTERHFCVGDYIRCADAGGANQPLFMVERTDLFRVVARVPDRDVPFTHPGNPAVVRFDALPGHRFPAKVSRIAKHEDPQTHFMRAEIDFPNPTNFPNPTRRIRAGMRSRVTVILEQAQELTSIPLSCVVGKVECGAGAVFVVHGGHAHRVSVHLGRDDGLRVAVLDGVTGDDEVVLTPGDTILEGAAVTVYAADQDVWMPLPDSEKGARVHAD